MRSQACSALNKFLVWTCCGFSFDRRRCAVWLHQEFCDLPRIGEIGAEFAQQHVQRCHPHTCSLLWRQPHRWAQLKDLSTLTGTNASLPFAAFLFRTNSKQVFQRHWSDGHDVTHHVRGLLSSEKWSNSTAAVCVYNALSSALIWDCWFSVIFSEYRCRSGGSFTHPLHPHPPRASTSYLLVLEAFLPLYISRYQASRVYKYVLVLIAYHTRSFLFGGGCVMKDIGLSVVPPARSPVFSHLSSSLQGLCTIRAFRAQERLQKAFDAHQDLHSGFLLKLICIMPLIRDHPVIRKRLAVVLAPC